MKITAVDKIHNIKTQKGRLQLLAQKWTESKRLSGLRFNMQQYDLRSQSYTNVIQEQYTCNTEV